MRSQQTELRLRTPKLPTSWSIVSSVVAVSRLRRPSTTEFLPRQAGSMYSRQVAFMRLGDTSHMSCWAVAASPRTLGSSSALCSFARLDRVVCTAFFSGREDMLFCQQTAVGTLIRGPLCSRNSALHLYYSISVVQRGCCAPPFLPLGLWPRLP